MKITKLKQRKRLSIRQVKVLCLKLYIESTPKTPSYRECLKNFEKWWDKQDVPRKYMY